LSDLANARTRARSRRRPRAGADAGDELGHVFAALADPTRRAMIDALLRDGTTSVPRLSAELPITRQAVAKHLATLDHAGVVERAPARGREVRYRLRDGALESASAWLAHAEAAWDERLTRLRRAVERSG
jgi:DNA-binding transcriptional ArsR family regulator